MAAKVSSEMLKARAMIEKGATPYGAAKACDLTVSAITRSPWYIEFEKNKPASDEPKVTAMDRAREFVTVQRKTAYEAAKLTGVAQSSISRAKWYRAHLAELEKSPFNFIPGVNHAEKLA